MLTIPGLTAKISLTPWDLTAQIRLATTWVVLLHPLKVIKTLLILVRLPIILHLIEVSITLHLSTIKKNESSGEHFSKLGG